MHVVVDLGIFVGGRQPDAVLLAHVQTGQHPVVGVGVDDGRIVVIRCAVVNFLGAGPILFHQHAPDEAHLVRLAPRPAGKIRHDARKGDAPAARPCRRRKLVIVIQIGRIVDHQVQRNVNGLGLAAVVDLAH